MKILLIEDDRETVELLAGGGSHEVTIVDRMLWH